MDGPAPEETVDTEALTTAGLGLDYAALRLARTTRAWVVAGQTLAERVSAVLDGSVAAVELVGSASVPGLLAKPIIDLAVGIRSDQQFAPVQRRLLADGWIYRGDAGSDGGRLFVLQTRPWYRVAHLHVVGHGDEQWRNYLRFRDLLRRDARARRRYEAVKTALAAEGVDRRSYTAGKTEVVTALLDADRAPGE